MALLAVSLRANEIATIDCKGAAVNIAIFTPDNQHVLAGCSDGSLRLYDIKTGAEIRRFSGHAGKIENLAISPDGANIYSAGADFSIRTWEYESGRETGRFGTSREKLYGAIFSPDCKRVLAASSAALRLWDLATGRELRIIEGHTEKILCMAFFPDGTRAISASMDNSVRIWNLEEGVEVKRVQGTANPSSLFLPGNDSIAVLQNYEIMFLGMHDGSRHGIGNSREYHIESAVFTPGGRWLVTRDLTGRIRRWDLATGRMADLFNTALVPEENKAGAAVSCSSDGKFVLVLGHGSIQVLDFNTGPQLAVFEGMYSRAAFVSGGQTILAADTQGVVHWIDVNSGRDGKTWKLPDSAPKALTLSADGTRLAIAANIWWTGWRETSDQTLPVVAPENGHEIISLQFSADNSRVLGAAMNKKVFVWDMRTGKELAQLPHNEAVLSATFTPNGLEALSQDRTSIRRWDMKKYTLIKVQSINATTGAVFSPDQRIAFFGRNSMVVLYDIESDRELAALPAHRVACVALSPDGRFGASGGDDKTVRLWDLLAGREVASFEGHSRAIDDVAFSRDGRWIISFGNEIRLWNAEWNHEIRAFHGHTGNILGVAASPGGTRIASVSSDDGIRLWDADSGTMLKQFNDGEHQPVCAAFSAKGTELITGGVDKTIRVWDLDSGAEKLRLSGHRSAVYSVAFLPDGKRAISGSLDGTVRVWNLSDQRELARFESHTDKVTSVSVSRDGKFGLSGSWDQTVRLWQLPDENTKGRELRRFDGHQGIVLSVALSPNGERALSGSADGTVRLWDTESGRQLRSFNAHDGEVLSVSFSPDGRLGASGSADRTVRVWDIESGKELTKFTAHKDWVCGVTFCGNTRLVSGSNDKTVRLYGLPKNE